MPVGNSYMIAVWDILFPVTVTDPFIENIECWEGVILVWSFWSWMSKATAGPRHPLLQQLIPGSLWKQSGLHYWGGSLKRSGMPACYNLFRRRGLKMFRLGILSRFQIKSERILAKPSLSAVNGLFLEVWRAENLPCVFLHHFLCVDTGRVLFVRHVGGIVPSVVCKMVRISSPPNELVIGIKRTH